MEPTIGKSSTPMELLEMALSKERAAVALYEEMLRHAGGALVKDSSQRCETTNCGTSGRSRRS